MIIKKVLRGLIFLIAATIFCLRGSTQELELDASFNKAIEQTVHRAKINDFAETDSSKFDQELLQEGIELVLTTDGRSLMGENLVLIAVIRNLDEQSKTIQTLKISAVGALATVYDDICSVSFKDKMLKPGESIVSTCQFTPKSLINLLYLSRQKTFSFNAELKIASRAQNINAVYKIELGRSETHVLFGAIFGVLVLTLFGYFNDGSENVKKGCFGKLPNYIVGIFSQTVRGLLLAIILLCFARATGTIDAPFSIRVEDFWGGAMIGLFSIPLSKWITLRLRSEN